MYSLTKEAKEEMLLEQFNDINVMNVIIDGLLRDLLELERVNINQFKEQQNG